MTIAQEAYRFGSEDGTESTHGFLAALNTAISRDATDATTFLVRILIQASGSGQINCDFQLQRSLDGGAFADVTTTSTGVKAVTTAIFADTDSTTQRLGGSGTFDTINQGCSHVGLSGGAQMDIATNGNNEVLYSVQLVPADLAAVTTITFRLLVDGSTLGGGYTVTPQINVTSAAVPAITSIDADDDTVDTRTGVAIVGTDFGASETGSAKVEVGDNAVYASGTKVEVDVTSWSATSITVTLRRESDAVALATLLTLPLSPAYLWVTSSAGDRNAAGFEFTLRPAGPTAVAAVNTGAEIDAGTIFYLRFRVENTGAEGLTGFKLKRSHNGGAYADVTTTSAVAEAVAAVAFADGDDVIEVLGGSGTYITDNNAGSEDGGFTLAANFPASGAVEAVFAVQIDAADVADADTVAFRVYKGDDTALDAYTNTPTITVSVPAIESLSFGLTAADTDTAVAAVDEVLTAAASFDDAEIEVVEAVGVVTAALTAADSVTAVAAVAEALAAPLTADAAQVALAEVDETAVHDVVLDATQVTTAGGEYVANPVNFDGTNDYLIRGADLTGSADSKLWTGSVWVRRTDNTGEQNIVFGIGLAYQVRFAPTTNVIEVIGEVAAGAQCLKITSSTAISDTAWHHIAWSIDMSDQAKTRLYIDDVADIGTINVFTTDAIIDFTLTDHAVGARTNATGLLIGDLADVQMWFGVYSDLDVGANRRNFISASGAPIDPATATAALGNQIVLLSGATDTWHTNDGTGEGYTENGAITDGTVPLPAEDGAAEESLSFGITFDDDQAAVAALQGALTGAFTADAAQLAQADVAETLTTALAAASAEVALAEVSEAATHGVVFDDEAVGDTDSASNVLAALALDGAQVALAALAADAPASALEADTAHAAVAALSDSLNAPALAGGAQEAIAALSGATATGLVAQDSAIARAALAGAVSMPAFLADSTQGDTATALEIITALSLAVDEAAVAALSGTLPAGATAAVDFVELADFEAALSEPAVLAESSGNVATGSAGTEPEAIVFGSAQSFSLGDFQVLLEDGISLGGVTASVLGVHVGMFEDLSAGAIMESTPHYLDPILTARGFAATNLTAKFQY